MSVTGRRGLEGENGPLKFLTRWYTAVGDDDPPIARHRSKGKDDVGDIGGVRHCMIECKNYTNPTLGTLLTNAQWKATNSGRAVWWLTYKRKGYGVQRAGYWDACTTLTGLATAVRSDSDLVMEKLAESMESGDTLLVTIDNPMPMVTQPEIRWKLLVTPLNAIQNIRTKRSEFLDAYDPHTPSLDEDGDLVVPVVISPRLGYGVEDWYAHTRVVGMARILESLGLIPQSVAEYRGCGIEFQQTRVIEGVLS